jgi:hypothetical protein
MSTPSNGTEQIFCCPLRALAASVWISRLASSTLMLVAMVDCGSLSAALIMLTFIGPPWRSSLRIARRTGAASAAMASRFSSGSKVRNALVGVVRALGIGNSARTNDARFVSGRLIYIEIPIDGKSPAALNSRQPEKRHPGRKQCARSAILRLPCFLQFPASRPRRSRSPNLPRNQTLIVENPEGTIKNAGWFNIWAVNAGGSRPGCTSSRWIRSGTSTRSAGSTACG